MSEKKKVGDVQAHHRIGNVQGVNGESFPVQDTPAPVAPVAPAVPVVQIKQMPGDLELSQKLTVLVMLYSNLYSELRDKDTRLTQVAGWGVTGLAASVLVTMYTPPSGSIQVVERNAWPLASALIVVCAFLGVLIKTIVRDRASVARRLNTIHLALGFFDQGMYGDGYPVLPESWRDWGSKGRGDALGLYGTVLILFLSAITTAAVFLLLQRFNFEVLPRAK